MGYLIGLIIGGMLIGLIPGIWALKKGHKALGIVSIVLCGLSGLFVLVQNGTVPALLLIVLLIIVACSKNLTKTEQGTDSNGYPQ